MKKIQSENRPATEEEQRVLVRYVGWGGLAEAFDEHNASWAKEYKELKELLTTEEYESASGSVLNAHFTPKGVIDGIYAGLTRLGVKNARVLEPSCGTGHFIGSAPEDLGLTFDAVELDKTTSDIAKLLYPTAKIQTSGFEDVKIENGTYDVVIGNVPFGDYKVYDDEYNRHKFMIHDYFLAKSLDKLRAGGIMAIITGKGTLDKQNSKAREYFASRAKLLGAYRLPDTTFKANAGTEAVADVLFFQKREDNIPTTELASSTIEWLHSRIVEENVPALNEYYISHEENVLGEFELQSGRFGTVRTVKQTSEDIGAQLTEAVKGLPENIYDSREEKSSVEKIKEEKSSIDEYTSEDLDEMNIRNFGLCVIGNRAYIRQNDKLIEPIRASLQGELTGKPLERLKAYIELRNQVRKIIDLQNEDCTDEVLQTEQQKLNTVYDAYVKKHGYVNTDITTRSFKEDVDFALVAGIEKYDDETQTASKRDIFFQRTIRRVIEKTHTDDVYEALALSKNKLGEVDLQYIEKLTDLSYEEITKQLSEEIYQVPECILSQDPETRYLGWMSREEYLSGNVVEKLALAKVHLAQAEQMEESAFKSSAVAALQRNVAKLESIQPKKLTHVDIKARIGATWIGTEDYKQFLVELLNGSSYNTEVVYNAFMGQYTLEVAPYMRHRPEATNIWGTSRMDAVDLFEHALNSRTPTVWDKHIVDGKEKRVVNKEETAFAREKLKDLQEEFAKWIWSKETRRQKYEDIYNKMFNNLVLPEYDGKNLSFDGMNAVIQLRDHQKDVVARISTGRNALLHHCVGAGKTFAMIASAMKLRQYGIANKPMIVVPNPLVMQWARDAKWLYPNAKVLVTTKEEFEKQNRRRFLSKIASGDWDMVIISESQFRRIPVSKERQLAKMESTIERIKESIEDCWDGRHGYGAKNRLTVKALRSALKKKEAKYKELTSKVSKMQDDFIEFEKLGIDYLFVDEAHAYKNKEIETSMTNVAGITTGGSERAFDLEMKIDYLSELHGGDKGVVFATGTPISNSMAEMFTMQSYLGRSALDNANIRYFDAWANTFGEVITSWELNTSGSGVKPRTRFSRFVNLPELQKMYRMFSDVKTAEMLDLPVPEARRHTITLPATEQILQMNDEIIRRGERIEQGGVDPTIDNMLKLTSDGKKLALDPRCLDPLAEDEEDTKVNTCIRKVLEIYEETREKKSTQVIFCDQSTPKGNEWSVYQDIKDKLMASGVREEEIAFIHEADTDARKEKLFKDMNAGRIRVLVGSTQKCGVGANFQERLIALHHLDVPYRPSDMEQREGRIIRQGNKNETVDIYSYITEKTFDSYSYQILENKQRFISQINKGDMTIREAGDIDETTLSFAQIKAIATANPDFLRQMELINTLKELRMLKQKHYENQQSIQSKLVKDLPEELARVGNYLELMKKDVADVITEQPKLSVKGVTYDERTTGAEALMIAYRNAGDSSVIGTYGGLKIVANKTLTSNIGGKQTITLKGNATYVVDLGESDLGNLTRLENVYKDIPSRIERFETRKGAVLKQLDELQANVGQEFPREDELRSVERELAEIEERLQVNKEEVMTDGGEMEDKPERIHDEDENDRW